MAFAVKIVNPRERAKGEEKTKMALQCNSQIKNKQGFINADGQRQMYVMANIFLGGFYLLREYSVSAEPVCRWESGGSWEVCGLLFEEVCDVKRWKWDSS